MKIIFAGTPRFAAKALSALLAAKHDIALVLTRPDRPAGRGLKEVASAVKNLAARSELKVLQPAALKSTETLITLSNIGADAMIVAAYGLLLPQGVLDLPRHGCINIHASLLPRWRGAAPIQRALLAGDAESGITIMQMDAGLDSGAILLQDRVQIAKDETAGTLHDKLAEAGARAIVTVLDKIAHGDSQSAPQGDVGVSYAAKVTKSEATVDWRRPAHEIDRVLRAFDPSPGARARVRGIDLKLWRGFPLARHSGAPGTVLHAGDSGVVVACGSGAIRLTELQKAGGNRIPAAAFLRGFPIGAGERFEAIAV